MFNSRHNYDYSAEKVVGLYPIHLMTIAAPGGISVGDDIDLFGTDGDTFKVKKFFKKQVNQFHMKGEPGEEFTYDLKCKVSISKDCVADAFMTKDRARERYEKFLHDGLSDASKPIINDPRSTAYFPQLTYILYFTGHGTKEGLSFYDGVLSYEDLVEVVVDFCHNISDDELN